MVSYSPGHLTFDYRLHRNPYFIYRFLLTQDSTKNLSLTHLYRGSVIYSYGSAPDRIQKKGFYKVDLQFEPYYNSRFGDKNDPFKTQVGIGPRLQLNSRNGFYGIFQWLFPLQNDFKNETGYGNRPGETGAGYTKILIKQHFFNAFAGTMTNRRYGLAGEYIFMNKQGTLYSGISIFYTGAYIYSQQTFTRERINYTSGYGFIAYRFKQTNLTLKATLERYLNNEWGGTFEAYRQFGNTDIGFYGLTGKNGENAGIKLVVALWPRKFYNNSWMQVRFPNSLGFQYDLKSTTQAGEQVRTPTDFFYEILRFNPNFIDQQIKSAGLPKKL